MHYWPLSHQAKDSIKYEHIMNNLLTLSFLEAIIECLSQICSRVFTKQSGESGELVRL